MLLDLFKALPLIGVSNFTIVYFVVLSCWGATRLLKTTQYKRWRHFLAFSDALFILGFLYLIIDLTWLTFNTVRWYGSPLITMNLGYWTCFLRDLVGLLFLFLVIGGFPKFNKKTMVGYSIYCGFLIPVFIFAPNPAYTDWVYGLYWQYANTIVYFSFFLSHVVAKIIIAFTYTTLFGGNKNGLA